MVPRAPAPALGHGAVSGEETSGPLRKERGRGMYLLWNWKRHGEWGFQNRSFKILGLDEQKPRILSALEPTRISCASER